MTANGWFQILLFLALVFADHQAAWDLHDPRVQPRADISRPGTAARLRGCSTALTGVDEDHEMRWTEYAVAMLMFSGVTMLLLYLFERLQQLPALESAAPRGRGAGPGVQHGRLVHHQHQLAELRRARPP